MSQMTFHLIQCLFQPGLRQASARLITRVRSLERQLLDKVNVKDLHEYCHS